VKHLEKEVRISNKMLPSHGKAVVNEGQQRSQDGVALRIKPIRSPNRGSPQIESALPTLCMVDQTESFAVAEIVPEENHWCFALRAAVVKQVAVLVAYRGKRQPPPSPEVRLRVPEKALRTKLHSIGTPRAMVNAKRQNPGRVALFVMPFEDDAFVAREHTASDI
jgi:hypothetical protein